jgi:hypothetical protein
MFSSLNLLAPADLGVNGQINLISKDPLLGTTLIIALLLKIFPSDY